MKKFLIIAAAVSLASVLLASCTGGQIVPSSTVKDKVEDAAGTELSKTVAAYFKDSISPNNVEADITGVDMEHEMNTEGLTETEADPEDDADRICWYDSENKLVYEKYTEDGEDTLVYHTSSASGRDLTVYYSDKDGVWTAYKFVCDDYTYTMDTKDMVFTIEVTAPAGTIGYLKTADTQWTISSALYDAEDGTHIYKYSVDEDGNVNESDKILGQS